MEDCNDFVEGVVCRDEDVKENEMKTFDLGEHGKVLLVRQNGKLSALGTKCTHYGAPLEKAALGDGRIRCQWHGACFNIMTGMSELVFRLDGMSRREFRRFRYRRRFYTGEIWLRGRWVVGIFIKIFRL